MEKSIETTAALEIRMYGETHRITLEPGETILTAANRARLDPPFSCQSGSCSTCRAKLISGRVVMDTNDVLSDDEVADGYILTCQSHPLTSELVVDYDA